ncbi:MAG: DUF1670 domain-containing protein [Bacillota bacterium]
MSMGKGASSKFSTLAARDLEQVQMAHLKDRFELAERSVLAEKAVELTNKALEDHEAARGVKRVKPGEILVEHKGNLVTMPLLDGDIMKKHEQGMTLKASKCQHEHEQYSRLLAADPRATYDDLWEALGRGDAVRKQIPKGFDFLPEEPLSADEINVVPRSWQDASVPDEVMNQVTGALVDGYGVRPGLAESMVRTIAGLRAWCSPKVSELRPGQVVWLARGVRKTRRADPKLFVPVILTLVEPGESKATYSHPGEARRVRMRQIERITAEAWRQDGVLTSSDIEWLTGSNGSTIRRLLEAYQERFGVILPTAGTILDMGRTLTHKKIVVEMSLSGLTTQEIARRIYHTTEAVDAYLKAFERVLLLRYYRVPMSAMVRITGHSQSLISEHIALAEKHFPTTESLAAYLTSRGVDLGSPG